MNISIQIILFILISSPLMGQVIFEDKSDESGIILTQMASAHGSGASAIDFDQDGDIDIYLCSEFGENDRLFENEQGIYIDVAATVGINHTMRTVMSIWFDYDNDDDLDFIVIGDCYFDEINCSELSPFIFYENNNGFFNEVTLDVGLKDFGPKSTDQSIGGAAVGDLNQDDYIDLIIAVRNGPLLAFINNGDKTFIESAEQLGLSTSNNKYYQPFIGDFNQDGLLDIYCNVDFGSNLFYLNRGTDFKDNSIATKSNNAFNEMGIAVGDFDNDLDLDIYSTNIENYLGNDYHNILLQNNLESGNLIFNEVSKEFNVSDGGWGWGATFFDANNDSWLDLATTNGWDVPFEVVDQSKFWINSGESFIDESSSSGFDDNFNAGTLISFDADRDGKLDLFQTTRSSSPSAYNSRLLINNYPGDNNYITIKPRLVGNNHFAIGTKIDLFHNGISQTRIIHAGTSFYGQEPYEAHFGVGLDTFIDSVHVHWPGGAVTKKYNIEVNQIIEINDNDVLHQPSALTAELDGSNVIINWSDRSSNETGFVIERVTIGQENSETYFELEENTTSFIDSSADYNSIFRYRIQAQNDLINSSFTEFVEIYSLVLAEEPTVNDEIVVYPNPLFLTGSNPTIYINGVEPDTFIKVVDIFGREIPVKKDYNTSALELKLDSKNTGMLILRINKKSYRIYIR